jgi:8-oxo-dGTP diphosphatase
MKLATLVYLRRNGQTLMMHRVKKANDIHEGKWNGLGGKLEPGESPEQCAIREVREESGLEIAAPRLRGLLLFADFKEDDWYVWVFTAQDFSGELIDSAEGRLAWIPDPDLPTLNLWPSDLVFLPWLEREQIFSARFQYHGEEVFEHEVVFY